MGMFDSVMVRCPRCGGQVEFQSKAGECYMNQYTPTDAPPAVLADTVGDKQTCRCGAVLEAVLMGPIPVAFIIKPDAEE